MLYREKLIKTNPKGTPIYVLKRGIAKYQIAYFFLLYENTTRAQRDDRAKIECPSDNTSYLNKSNLMRVDMFLSMRLGRLPGVFCDVTI